jgi:hypothetical protein
MKTRSNQSGLTFEKYDRDHIAIYFNETVKEVPAGIEAGETQTVYEYDTLIVAGETPSEAAFAAAVAAAGYGQLEAEAIAAGIIFAAVQKGQLHGDALEAAKNMVIARISAYDASSAVNGFYLNGNEMWIPRELRNELSERIAREEARGHATVPFDYNGQEITLPINDDVKTMLEELKYYADDCYTQTQRHKAAVAAKRSVNTVLSYDFTTGYPQKLSFSLSE